MRIHCVRVLGNALLLAPLLCAYILLGCGSGGSIGNGGSSGNGGESEPSPNSFLIEGELLHVSPLPDHQSSPYKDCLFSTSLHVSRVEDGAEVEEQILLLLPGFLDRKLTENAGLSAGAVRRFSVVPFSELDAATQSLQLSDSVEEIGLPVYFSQQVSDDRSTVLEREPTTGASPTVRFKSPDKPVASAVQTEIVENEMDTIRRMRDQYGGWDPWMETLRPLHATLKENATPIFHEDASIRNWNALDAHFAAENPQVQAMVDSLVNLKDGLGAHGVDLIVAPLPSRDLIGIDHIYQSLRPADQIWNPQRLRRNLFLLEHGIEVLDSTRDMREAMSERKHPLFFFETTDSHPAGGAMLAHGKAIATRLLAYPEVRNVPREAIDLTWHYKIPVPGAPLRGCPFKLSYSHPEAVSTEGPVPPDNDSKVMLFGDSFLGGGIRDVTTAELGFRVASVMRQSGTKDMARHLARTNYIWSNFEAAVFVFDDVLLNAESGSPWQVVDFAGEVSETAEYRRRSRTGTLILRYNSYEDFQSLCPEEKPEGFLATEKRAYIPYAHTDLHIQSPACTIKANRLLLIHLSIRTRGPQSVSLTLDREASRTVELNRGINTLQLVLRPTKPHRHLGIQVQKGGGNLFIEAFSALGSAAK